MATWTTIPDSSLEPGKPIRSIDTLALRDNPVAIAEGAAGAPRVNLPAIVAALASVPVGSIGSYAFLGDTTSTTTAVGATKAGSSLRYSGAVKLSPWNTSTSIAATQTMTGQSVNTAPDGTWRAMGYAKGGVISDTSVYPATLWLRIA